MTVDLLRSAAAKGSAATSASTLHVSASTRRTQAVLAIEPVRDEIERRAAIGLGGLLDESLLETLLTLPVDIKVPIEVLSVGALRELATAPPGCVEFTDDAVVRRAVSPIRVLSAGVCAATWRAGLSQAGQFASYCARYAVLTRKPRELDRAEMEARYYGIGLATMMSGTDSLVWIVQPAPFRATRETVASWHFSESALEAMAQSRDHSHR